jgi:hypothetical protein
MGENPDLIKTGEFDKIGQATRMAIRASGLD